MSDNSQTLTDRLIEIFGSTAAVARAADVDRSRIYRWGDDVPLDRRVALVLAAPQLGIDPSQVFDIVTCELFQAHQSAQAEWETIEKAA